MEGVRPDDRARWQRTAGGAASLVHRKPAGDPHAPPAGAHRAGRAPWRWWTRCSIDRQVCHRPGACLSSGATWPRHGFRPFFHVASTARGVPTHRRSDRKHWVHRSKAFGEPFAPMHPMLSSVPAMLSSDATRAREGSHNALEPSNECFGGLASPSRPRMTPRKHSPNAFDLCIQCFRASAECRADG